jgi:phosphatidylserine decarboxylase
MAREGWAHVLVVALIAVAVTTVFGWFWSIPAWAAFLFVIQFFRDPRRLIPAQPNLAVLPADGKVVFVGTAKDPYLGRNARKISVFMNVFSVHSNRIPVSGRVERMWYTAGEFINAALDKSSERNERNAVWIRTEDDQDVVCVQVAGLVARRILCYLKPGQRVERGQRYGFIRFGSRVDVYLPMSFICSARLGDWVYAGKDVLGHFERQAVPADKATNHEYQARVQD